MPWLGKATIPFLTTPSGVPNIVPMKLPSSPLPCTLAPPVIRTPSRPLSPIELPPLAIASPIVLFDDWAMIPRPALLKTPLPWIRLPTPPAVSISRPAPPAETPKPS